MYKEKEKNNNKRIKEQKKKVIFFFGKQEKSDLNINVVSSSSLAFKLCQFM